MKMARQGFSPEWLHRCRLFFELLVLPCWLLSCDTPVRVGLIGDQFGAVNADSSFAVMDRAVQRLMS